MNIPRVCGPTFYSLTETSFCKVREKRPGSLEPGRKLLGEKNYFFRASSTATATETVIPTMGLLPATEARRKQASVGGFIPEKLVVLA